MKVLACAAALCVARPALGLTGHAGGDAVALHAQSSIIEQDEAVPPHFGRHVMKTLQHMVMRALAAGASAKSSMPHVHQFRNLAAGVGDDDDEPSVEHALAAESCPVGELSNRVQDKDGNTAVGDRTSEPAARASYIPWPETDARVRAMSLPSRTAGWEDCKSAETSTYGRPIHNRLQSNGWEVTIGHTSLTNLKCVGAGAWGITYSGQSTKPHKKTRLAKFFFNAPSFTKMTQAEQKAAVTGAQTLKKAASNSKRPKLVNLAAKYFVTAFEHAKPTDNGAVLWESTDVAQVWEYASGVNFEKVQEDKSAISDSNACGLAKQVCEAIVLLQTLELNHGDILYSNMIWADGKTLVKIIDYDTLKPRKCHYAANGDMAAMFDDAYMFFELGFVKQCDMFNTVRAKFEAEAADLAKVKIAKDAMRVKCPLPDA